MNSTVENEEYTDEHIEKLISERESWEVNSDLMCESNGDWVEGK